MKSSLVDDYLDGVPNVEFRASLASLRALILEELPEAVECISYGMPGYKINGYICGFAAFKAHCSFFPGGIAQDFADHLQGFKISKGTIQFSPENPIPERVLRTILQSAAARDSLKAKKTKKK